MAAVAPLSSTIVALGLIPVAFLFVHAFYSGLKHKRFHVSSGVAAIVWDLSLSIGYMLYRSFDGAVEGSTIQLDGALTAYFAGHGAVAVVVMALEVVVLGLGAKQVRNKQNSSWHSKLAKVLFGIWWFAFLSGELFYLAMYIL
jgi:uncharacterized membrane protein YozB (DUF420 family)